ncbi:MAG: 30S ribosomal protein S1 [Chloroflexi bacterium]|nr:30S ribosomal protein S1 [Chloroflexota bacterium]
MDDGYWESLLRDVEDEADAPAAKTDGDDESSHLGSLAIGAAARKWIGSPPQEDEADWSRATQMLESGETVAIAITGCNRGGLLADFGTVQGFLPASHLVVQPPSQAPASRMNALAARVGEMLTVKVVEIDRERRRLILSERLAQGDGNADLVLASLRPGQTCQGQITNLCPFGAFVDLGGFEGLIHISELSWGRVGSSEEVVHPGDRVEMMVLEVNPQEQKVSLSLKRLRPDPWQGVEARYRVGQLVDAMITNVVNFGAFARLEEGLEGLIHISELAQGSFMHPRNVVREGDRVRARVLAVDGGKRRIALTLRAAEAGRPRPEFAPQTHVSM